MSNVISTVSCLFFVLLVLLFVIFIGFSIYEGIQINNIQISSGYVVDKYVFSTLGSKSLRVKISYDLFYNGQLITRVKSFNVNAEQYSYLEVGDIVYFDNNMPVFDIEVVDDYEK